MTTAKGIITSAMRKIGALTKDEAPSADEAAAGLEMLNDLLASISNDSMTVYARTEDTLNLSGGTSTYTIGSGGVLDTVRPIKIIAAYVRSGGVDYSLKEISDELYATVSFKTSGGIPEFINFTNGFPLATLKFYPVPSTDYQLFLVSEKPLAEFTLSQTVSLPPGWKRMLVYNLAVEMSSEYGQPLSQEVVMLARDSKAEIRQAIMAAKKMQWNSGLGIEGNIYTGWNY